MECWSTRIIESMIDSEDKFTSDFLQISAADSAPERKDQLIKEFASIFNAQAYDLKDILKAMDADGLATLGLGSRISRYERQAIHSGEGADVFQFWKSMNALNDYSHLVEDTPDPGGKKQRAGVMSGLGKLVGGLTPGAWQPA